MVSLDYSKISITAKLVAFVRQFSDIPFAEDVATYINARDALLVIARNLKSVDGNTNPDQNLLKVYAPLIEARYKSVARLIEQTGIKQVLELASGFSLRGLAMTQDKNVTYIDTDLEELNEEKIKLVTGLREQYNLPDRDNYRVITANALEKSSLEAATASLNHNEPLVVANEGLIPYLSTKELETLADNVRYLLSQFKGGAWITPDFATKQTAHEDISEDGKRFRAAINEATGRQLHDSAFSSEDEINHFLSTHGFSGTVSYQTDLVTLVSPERLDVDAAVIERLKPRMRIWLLSPQ